MLTARVPLRYGLVAEIVAADDDRPAPAREPARPPAAHHPACPCHKCQPPPERHA